MAKPNLGRIGELAEKLRLSARLVSNELYLTAGGDAYEYRGSTADVDYLVEAINDLERFQAGWIDRK